MKVFDDTVAYAGLRDYDTPSDSDGSSDDLSEDDETQQNDNAGVGVWKPLVSPPALRNAGATPLSERLQVVTTGNQLTISAALVNGREVDKLIKILQANKALLDDEEGEDDPIEGDD